jgi:hypothetical protein
MVYAPGLILLAACATAPASKSPLKERLETSGNSDVETSVRTCLKEGGWKVDDVAGYHGGANVVTAYKAKDQTDVYIYPSDQHPRITGGPDDGNPFWKCVARELGAGDKDKDSSDKDKDKKDEGSDKDKDKDKDTK